MLSPDAHLFGALREFFRHYGYWTIACMLLVENAGVPAPGEATLLFASVLASYEHQLRLPLIIVVAIAASVLGDNVGYAVGYFGGRPQHALKGRRGLPGGPILPKLPPNPFAAKARRIGMALNTPAIFPKWPKWPPEE